MIIHIEARNIKGQVRRCMEVNSRDSYTKALQGIDIGINEELERWVVIYDNETWVDEFLVE